MESKSIFLTKRLLLANAASLSKEADVDLAIEMVNKILTDRKAEIIKAKKEESERKEALENAVKELQSKGISKDMIAQFLGIAGEDKQVKEGVVKYLKDGVSWSGRGKAPSVFAGISKDELEAFKVD